MNSLEKKILKVYRDDQSTCYKCQDYCKKHKLELHGPLSFFNVGNEFEDDTYKVVFVGKTHWYNKEDVDALDNYENLIFRDCRNDGHDMFKNHPSKFWVYIKRIAQQLYPDIESMDNLLNCIAITNLTKCNTSQNSRDTTPYTLTDNCVKKFKKEIEVLSPKHLIFFTGGDYDEYLLDMNFGFSNSPKNITSPQDKRRIGNLNVLWWEREFLDSNRKMRVLRTRHPVRAPKEFPDKIFAWIKANK
jgi:hypothetical protein